MATQQLAQGLAGLGRNGDSMLMHVSPQEVKGLQALAMSQGGSLTINPETGLPEASFLSKLIGGLAPVAAGFALGPAGFGLFDSALTTGLAVGAGTYALTGDPMAAISGGFGGAGGFGLGKNLAGFGKVAEAPATTSISEMGALPSTSLNPIATTQAGTGAADVFNNVLPEATANTTANLSKISATPYLGSTGEMGANMAFNPQNLVGTTQQIGGTGINLAQGAAPASQGIASAVKSVPSTGFDAVGRGINRLTTEGPSKYFDYIRSQGGSPWQDAMTVGLPVLGAFSEQPALNVPTGTTGASNYAGPYLPNERKALMPTASELEKLRAAGSPEYQYFNPSNPYPGYRTYASGGIAEIYGSQDGNVADNTPQDGYGLGRLQRLADGGSTAYAKGGYLDGPGDGMSDSIPATIEDKQPARLADGEFVVPADVVSHLGNGSTKAGAKHLYNMMDKVRKARTGTVKQGRKINPNKFVPV